MQPLERKQTKVQSGVARARVLLKHGAPWLPGYPTGIEICERSGANRVRWCSAAEFTFDQPTVWMIDREGLRRAQMTFTKVRHRFPRALPKLVTDVESWSARTELLLELLKNAIHSGYPLSSANVLSRGVLPKRWTDEIARIKTARPSLARLMDAVTFSVLSNLQPCNDDQIEWLQQHADSLSQLVELRAENACELPMLLLSVRDAISGTFLQTTIRCFTDPAIQQCRWENMDQAFDQLKDALKKAINQNEFSLQTSPDNERLGELVRRVLYRMSSLRPKRRREVFALLEQLLNPVLLDSIAETQHKILDGERRSRKLLRRVESGHELIPRTKNERRAWLEVAQGDLAIDSAQTAAAKALGKTLRGMLNDREASEKTWARFISAFPEEHVAIATRLMAKWTHGWYGSHERKKDLVRILEPLSLLFRRKGIAAPLLKNWHDHVSGINPQYEFVTDTCYDVAGQPKLAKRAVALLEKTVYDLQLRLGPGLLASLVEFAQATSDDGLCVALIERLSKKPDNTYVDSAIRIAMLFGDSPDEMADILVSMHTIGDFDEFEKELKPLAGEPELRRMVAKRIIAGDTALLMRLTATIGILHDFDLPLPQWEARSQSLEWCSCYPDEFQSALQSLNEASPDAEHIAENVLGKFYPKREALQNQIGALRTKLETAKSEQKSSQEFDETRIHQRLANLEKRLAQGTKVSPKRRDDLIEKLNGRADEERLQRFAHQCRQLVSSTISDRLEIQTFPEELLSPPMDRVLREIHRLNKPMRKLGTRLLFETAHRTTQGFDEEPKNVAFASRMKSIGIDLRPWLSDRIRQTAEMADGTPYELAFTRDVVDFLLMGFHFDTCLSPNSCNFFSTIANAVDLNKRVVYGKTEAGKVIGRCLFALNDCGEILTYYRYSHNPKDGFGDAVDQFAGKLASEMQTCLGRGGHVAKLVASDWYDDGPLSGHREWFGEGGLVTDLAARFESNELLAELVDSVGEKMLRQRIVEVATSAPLCERADFLSALLDQFGGRMSFRQRFTVAVNIEPENLRAGLLVQLRWSEIVRLLHRNQCSECDVFHGIAGYDRVFRVLTQYHPSLGLRAIRAARPSSIQDDLQDHNQTRRTALSEAHSQLGRHHLAEKLAKL